MESIFKLGIVLSVLDKVTGPSTRIGKGLGDLKRRAESLGPAFEKFKSYGIYVATAGAAIMHVLSGAAMSAAPAQKALGEISSVGVQDLNALSEAARKFTNQWAGSNAEQFITGAYDIKSGISSLSDVGVAEFSRLAALTAKATKSTATEMTSLFATGYGIYKDFYKSLGDEQFGALFSAGISSAVNRFKTDGSKMAQAIENLGKSAVVAGVPLAEQWAVLGRLQTSMKSGSEAGTAYAAYIRDVGRAGQRLGLNFLDANKQIKSMPDVLRVLIDRFGKTWDAVEMMKIQSAFGDESWKAVSRLYENIGLLSDDINAMGTALSQGTTLTEQMAMAMNRDLGAGMDLLAQRAGNLSIIIGNALTPVLMPLFKTIGDMIIGLQGFAMRHQTLTRVLVISIAVIGTLAFVFGTLAAAAGAVGLIWPNVTAGFGLLAIAASFLKIKLLAALPAVWAFTAALLANPITWIVLAIVALVAGLVLLYRRFEIVRRIVKLSMFGLGYLMGVLIKLGKAVLKFVTLPQRLLLEGLIWIYRHFDQIKVVMQPFISALGALAMRAVNASMAVAEFLLPVKMIKTVFNSIMKYFSNINLFESGASVIKTLVDGIVSVIDMPEQIIRSGLEKIRSLLPFSDAKEGPLSTLTLSGMRILETLGRGVQAAVPRLKDTLASALGVVGLQWLIKSEPIAAPAMQAPPAVMPSPGPRPQRDRDQQERPSVTKQITIRIERLELPGVKDAPSFIHQLERLVEAYDG